MAVPLLVTLTAAACATAAAAAARVEVPFSYAWRFHFGPGPDDGPGPGNGWAFPNLISNCTNLYDDPDRITPADCATACAYNPSCMVWLHNYVPWAQCLHGDANAACTPAKTNASATGASRSASTPLQTSYDFAAAALPDDASWPVVDAPHDALMSLNNTFSPVAGDPAHGYRVRSVVWYRKHFTLPAAWAPAAQGGDGSVVFVRFEGVVHVAQLWLNGAYLGVHNGAYGGFTVRLDNVSAAVWGGANVLALRADAAFGSGHWYEGGGIARFVTLVRTSPVNLVEDGVFAPAELAPGATTATVSAEWQNTASTGGSITAAVQFDLLNATSGALLASASSAPATAPAGGTGTVTSSAQLALPPAVLAALWSPQSPTLYTLNVSLVVLGAAGGVVDSTAVMVGYRSTRWDAATGFYLNGEPVRLRGFSHHNSFAGVGVAMPLRLDVFRAQAARALGASTWRMTHNPAAPGLYGLLDALGMMVWNEVRDFGSYYTSQAHDMAKRDRNHPSVLINSLCNEVECLGPPAAGVAAVAAFKAVDPSRPATSNTDIADGLYAVVDVAGWSHRNTSTFASLHAERPNQPLVSSECCSCTSQRLSRDPVADHCIASQNEPLDLPYVAGSLGVWTLVDYFGEPAPRQWPAVSSNFGQLDLAGLPKPNAYWYTTNWREGVPEGDPSHVPLPPSPVARVTDLLDALPVKVAAAAQSGSSSGNVTTVTLHGITSASTAELIADGVPVGGGPVPSNGTSLAWTFNVTVPSSSCAAWPLSLDGVQCLGLTRATGVASAASCEDAACAAGARAWQWDTATGRGCWMGTPSEMPCPPPGERGSVWVGGGRTLPPVVPVRNATLVARDAAGTIVATHTVLAPALPDDGAPAALALVVDVPSAATGTGTSLLLDGSDAGLVRVATVDAAGVLVSGYPVNVTFSVVSGPGRIAGVGSGNPAAHEQPNGALIATFGGLARAVVQVAVDCTSPHRDVVLAVDADAGARTTVVPPDQPCPTAPIVVSAVAPGLAPVTIAIPVSGDAAVDGPVPAAVAGAGAAAVAYLRDFVG